MTACMKKSQGVERAAEQTVGCRNHRGLFTCFHDRASHGCSVAADSLQHFTGTVPGPTGCAPVCRSQGTRNFSSSSLLRQAFPRLRCASSCRFFLTQQLLLACSWAVQAAMGSWTRRWTCLRLRVGLSGHKKGQQAAVKAPARQGSSRCGCLGHCLHTGGTMHSCR